MTESETVGLTSLPRRLMELTGTKSPSYQKIWKETVQGNIPAKLVNNRWQVKITDLSKIAAVLGMTPD